MRLLALLLIFSALDAHGQAASDPSEEALAMIKRPGSAEEREMTAHPGPRAGHCLVYDEGQRRVVLLDGYPPPDQPQFTEVWTWDGRQWRLIPGDGPAARTLSGAVYDSGRKRIVSFGGIRGYHDTKNDTWEWDGKSWRQMTDTSVGARDHHAMAYDEARDKTVLYGGGQANAFVTDTWQWDGAKWTRLATPGPGGRSHFAMAYDSKRKQVVLFGGVDKDEKYYNDTWVWDGRSWRMVSESGPPYRARHRMAFDRRAGVVLLYGGDRGTSVTPSGQRRFETLEDMWQWDGQRWIEVRLNSPTPGQRFMHALAYDATRGKIVLYGGSDGERDLADTWEWDGRQWAQIK